LGTVNLSEKLRFVEEGKAVVPSKHRNRRKQVLCQQVKILGATVSCEAGHWYVSIQVDIKKPLPTTPEPVVGVDVGLKTAAVVSDGRRLENQKPLALHRKRLGTLQRRLSRKQKIKDPETGKTKFSQNYEKQRVKVARKHQQLASIRADVQHKFTTELARTAGAIGIEDLHILGMMALRKLARAVADAAMGQLLTFLKNKVASAGGQIFLASRWFPSRHPLFRLRAYQKTDASQASHLSVSGLWAGDRSRSECFLEPGTVCTRHASPTFGLKLAVLGSGYDR
jgi:putative transposase